MLIPLSHHGTEHHISKFGNHNIQEPLSWIQRLVQQLVQPWRQIAEFLNGQGWNIKSKKPEKLLWQISKAGESYVMMSCWLFVLHFVLKHLFLVFAFSWALGALSCSRSVASKVTLSLFLRLLGELGAFPPSVGELNWEGLSHCGFACGGLDEGLLH